MASAPALGPAPRGQAVRCRSVLLLNPFYPKDPRASFGKHVLTPTLALTSIAGATPPHWDVQYWDENLLQGPPPCDPPPQLVGITVHLTFARRAYELAAWYRSQGSLVILGGLHVLSCPEEALQHADAIATIETGQNGKLFAEMRAQARIAQDWLYYFGGLADKIEGTVIPLDRQSIFNYTLREPLGVVGVITPWNSPTFIAIMSLAPALAAGNTIVLKPSEITSASAIELARLAQRLEIRTDHAGTRRDPRSGI